MFASWVLALQRARGGRALGERIGDEFGEANGRAEDNDYLCPAKWKRDAEEDRERIWTDGSWKLAE